MGGDHGPKVVVEGAVAAARDFGISSVLVGDQAQIEPLLRSVESHQELPIKIHHASQVVGMDEAPGLAIRGKQDSSIRVAFELVAQGAASAVVSPGNTGAIMAAGVFVGGTLPGIARPAIASLIPKGVSGGAHSLVGRWSKYRLPRISIGAVCAHGASLCQVRSRLPQATDSTSFERY